jgi:hypothetical protein
MQRVEKGVRVSFPAKRGGSFAALSEIVVANAREFRKEPLLIVFPFPALRSRVTEAQSLRWAHSLQASINFHGNMVVAFAAREKGPSGAPDENRWHLVGKSISTHADVSSTQELRVPSASGSVTIGLAAVRGQNRRSEPPADLLVMPPVRRERINTPELYSNLRPNGVAITNDVKLTGQRIARLERVDGGIRYREFLSLGRRVPPLGFLKAAVIKTGRRWRTRGKKPVQPKIKPR